VSGDSGAALAASLAGPIDSAIGSSAARSSAVARTTIVRPVVVSSTSITRVTWARAGSVTWWSCACDSRAVPRNARSIGCGPLVTAICARNRPSGAVTACSLRSPTWIVIVWPSMPSPVSASSSWPATSASSSPTSRTRSSAILVCAWISTRGGSAAAARASTATAAAMMTSALGLTSWS